MADHPPPSSDAIVPVLTPAILPEIYAHAQATYPEECCGFLLGPRDTPAVDAVRRCVNEQNRYHALDPAQFPRTAREAYFLGGKDLRYIAESMGSERPVKIIYHSHPDVGAYFSAEDTRAALGKEPDETATPFYPVDYMVIDAQSDHIAGAKLFRWDPTQLTFVHIAAYTGER